MQTLADLIRPTTAKERQAFAALSGDAFAFKTAELQLIKSALLSHIDMMNESSANFSEIADGVQGRNPSQARKFRTLANEQCIAACDARELFDRLSKVVKS